MHDGAGEQLALDDGRTTAEQADARAHKAVRIDGQYGFLDIGGPIDAYFAAYNLTGDLGFDDALVGREVMAYVADVEGGKRRAARRSAGVERESDGK